MNLNVKRKLAAAGLSLALLGAGTSVAGPGFGPGPRGDHPPSPGRMIERMAEHLDLSEEQKSQIEQIYADSHERGEVDRERLMALRSQLRGSSEDFDSGAVQAAADEIGQITSRMTYRMASTQHQVREVLTEDQRAELDAWAEKRKERHGKRHWRRDAETPAEDE